MNARVVVAQNEPSIHRGLDGHSPRLIRLNKPQGDQALTIHLDGRVQLDFSAIAGENITLVHAGDRLVILFDNRAAVTLDPFYGPDGQPLPAISIHLGPDRDVSGIDFAALFPVTTDQSVLPATGNGSPAVGGGFAPSPPQVDALATGQALPLLEADAQAARGSTTSGETHSVNRVPTAVADQGAVIEAGVHPGNTPFAGVSIARGNVLANDVDLDPGDIKLVVGVAVGTAAAVTGQVGTTLTGIYGSLVLDAQGSWTYTLDNANAATQALAQGVHGSDVFTYTMRDAQGETSTTTLTLDVLGSNDAPVMSTGAALALHEDSGQTQSSARHVAAGTLGFSDVDLSDSHTVDVALGAAQWSGGKAIPAATLSDAATALSAVITADSPGAAGSIGWSFGLGDADLDFLGAGETLVLTYQVTVTDSQSASAMQTVTMTITGSNDAPVITAASSSDVTEQRATTGSSIPDQVTGKLAFTDVDISDGHTAAVTGVASSGTLSGLGVTAADLQSFLHIDSVTKMAGSSSGSVGWTFSAPDSTFDYLGAGETLTLTYKVALDDHHGGTADSTISITVTGTNDAPALQPSAPALPGITEDQTTPSGTTVASLLANHVTDADAGAAPGIAITGAVASHGHWQFSIDGGSTWSDFATYSAGSALLLAPTDLVRMVPDGNDGGLDSFSFVAWDQTSGQHGLTIDASTRDGSSAFSAQSDTATITVEAINDAPVIHAPTAITIASGTSLTLANSFAITVTDVDAGAGAVSLGLSVTHGSLYLPSGNLTIPTQGATFTGSLMDVLDLLKDAVFTPDSGFIGQAFISIACSDNGHTGAGGALLDSQLIVIDVAPSAGDHATTDEDTALTVDATHGVLANTDPTASLNVANGDFSTTHGGSVHFNSDGSYSYTPAQDFNGIDTVDFTVDGPSGPRSGTLSIAVNAVNDAPVVHAPAVVTVAAGGRFTFSGSNAISVTDVDSGDQIVGQFVSVTHGTLYLPSSNLTIVGGGLITGPLSPDQLFGNAVFTPDPGFTGQAKITISVSDNGHSGAGGSLSDSKTVIINVENSPVITSGIQTADIIEDFAATVPATERITNGGFEATAPFSGWTNTGFVAISEPHTGTTSVGSYLGTYSLSQTLATVAGITYHVSFWASNPFDNGVQSEGMTVNWNGATVFALGDIPPSGGYRNFTHYGFDVMATGASSALSLTMWDTQGWWVLDDVSVTAQVTPGTETTRGIITFSDADHSDTHAVSYTTPAGSHYYGTFTPTLTHDTTGTGTGGTVDWSFSVDDSTIHFLAANQTLTQTYTVSIDDGHGGHATQDVTVTLHGTNDAPVGVNDTIIINGYSGAAPGTAAATPVFNETESNGAISTANAIDRTALVIAPNANLTDATDPSITIHGALSSNSDKDYYKIDLKAGETVTLDIDNSTGGLDSYIRLYNGGGTQIAVNDDSSSTSIGGGGSSTTRDSYLSYSVTQDGTYYVQVGSFNSASKGAYDLQLSVDSYKGLSGAPASIATAILLANDTDADDGHVLSITGLTGTGVSLNGDHILVQPNVTSFSYTVSDGITQSTATVSVIQKSGQSSTGTIGDDILFGTSGADSLDGAGGNDVLIGGLGNDTLTGGNGHDRFVFAESGTSNLDRILDFSPDDTIDLSGLLDAAIGNGSNVADVVRVVRGAPGSSDVTVQVDTDGAAAGATWTDVAVLSNYNMAGNVIQAIFEHAQHQLTVA
ncbi:hypothetical protein S58_31520 [Bradyrhizobium oligotrophicum S58]|uniref:Tandem-95 repeat protein n=1 Tax=Bradyrhizobium oligotrophicum S58 TaxID=1245469 RepID=M4ZSE4_9BRAD|nr:VCBS domain-containing protein [Bradyrhizobium oligotrophicum]BAM89150.1 hypothetical protein S58_31520 [Bradyrhizobium oligotrophicum S58]